jgi:hypothetical protein
MRRKLHFDVRDITACARYGLSARKLWVFFKALVLGWACWTLFVYLGFLAADPSGLGARWEAARLLPLPADLFWQSWQSVALLAIGISLVIALVSGASLRACRITFEQIRGDDFYSAREASDFARSHWKPLLAVPATLVAGLGLAVLAGMVLGLVARIPEAGAYVFALSSVPAWGGALLCVLAAAVLLVGLVMVPAIVACTRGDTFETMFELFSTVTSQPWRLVLYWAAAKLAILVSTVVFLVSGSVAGGVVGWAVSLGLGRNPAPALSGGLQVVAPQAVGGFSTGFDVLGLAGQGSAWPGPSGWLLALAGCAIVLILVSYVLSSVSSASTLIYLAIRKRKDGEDLLQRADDEDFREFEKQYGSADESRRGPAPEAARQDEAPEEK